MIKRKLEAYFEGKTTPEDEQLLIEFFRSEKVPEELQQMKPLFTGLEELSQPAEDNLLGDTLMNHILEQESRQKIRYRWMWRMVTGVAASILLVLGSLLIYEQQKQPFTNTYEDPELAYIEVEKTLRYMAGKYQNGLSHLQHIQSLEEASQPLNKGMGLISKGFEEAEANFKLLEEKTIKNR